MVPDGWAPRDDNPSEFVLVPTSTSDAGIYLFREPVAHLQTTDCRAARDPSVATDPRALGSWIASLSGLKATPLKTVTVGGLSGVTFDVTVAATWTHACPYSNGAPFVPMIMSAVPGSDLDWGLGAGGGMRVVILNAGGGRTLWIDFEATTLGTYNAVLKEAAPILDSFVFAIG